jgi:hypothetical protein
MPGREAPDVGVGYASVGDAARARRLVRGPTNAGYRVVIVKVGRVDPLVVFEVDAAAQLWGCPGSQRNT